MSVDSITASVYYKTMNITERHIAELMTDDTVFITPVGSRLYGLENAESDYDYFIIRDNEMKKNTHSVQEKYDIRVYSAISLHEMLMRKPTHTALEALYSPQRVLGSCADKWMPLLDGIRPGLPQLRRTFLSTAIGTLDVKDSVKFKRFRMGLMLADKYVEATKNGGRYNPQLSPDEAANLTARAEDLFAGSDEDRRRIILAKFGEPNED